MKQALAIKFLAEDGKSPVQHFAWPKPRGSRPGRWVKAEGELRVCTNGIHACKPDVGMLEWMNNPSAWLIELDEATYDENEHKYVARRGRLLRRLDWNEANQRLFAADCAEHVLKIFEDKHPGDKRPRKAIQAAREFAKGQITQGQLDAARDAAGDAARAAAGDAARAAARAAAGVAAWDAARDAEREWQARRLLKYLNCPEVTK